MNTVTHSVPSISVTQCSLTRARWSTRAQFVVLGVVSGAWGAHIPSVKQYIQLNEASLSMTLLALAVGVLFSLFFVGRVVARLSARISALIGGLLACAALSGILLAPSFAFVLPIAFFSAPRRACSTCRSTQKGQNWSIWARAQSWAICTACSAPVAWPARRLPPHFCVPGWSLGSNWR